MRGAFLALAFPSVSGYRDMVKEGSVALTLTVQSPPDAARRKARDRNAGMEPGPFALLIDGLALALVLIGSAPAVAVFAVAAPLAIAVSALAGIFTKQQAGARWRSTPA